MPKVTITLQDRLNGDGKSVCSASFKLDREGYPLNAPPSEALMMATAIRILGDLGVISAIMPLIETKLQHEELINYLKSINALDDDGNIYVQSTRPTDANNAVKIIDPNAIEVADAATGSAPASS